MRALAVRIDLSDGFLTVSWLVQRGATMGESRMPRHLKYVQAEDL